MATTPNFSWPTPDNTDLVKNGALAIRTLGDAIDASLVDLEGGTTDQVLAKNSNTDMDFKWVTSDDANAIQNAIVDAKGDLIAASAADTPARLAVGTDYGFLQADSTTGTGLLWNNAAFTTYTPTITSETGSFTTITTHVAKSTRIGKFCGVELDFSITSVGTAGNGIIVTLPYTLANEIGGGVGREKVVAGYGVYITAAGSNTIIRKFDNSSPIQANARLALFFSYEVA